MIHIVTWLWGDGTKYNAEFVHKLRAAVARHLKQPHEFICVSDRRNTPQVQCKVLQIPNPELTKIRGCFARLVMFSPAWQEALGVTDRLALIDLDTIITKDLDQIFDRPEPFVIMQGGNASNPCPYNGALMMLRPGVHAHVWQNFSVAAASKVPFYSFPDDQGWIASQVKDAAGWKCGTGGVYVFNKPGWPGGNELPDDARLVTFINRTPRDMQHLDWVRKHWR